MKDYRKLIKLIESDGWYLIKNKGGHMQFKHPTKKGKVTITKEVNKNIELSVLRQCGLRKSNESNSKI